MKKMNKLKQIHLKNIESSEYEVIKNSAIYKVDLNKASLRSARTTWKIAIGFTDWCTINASPVFPNKNKCVLKGNLEEITTAELFEKFISTFNG